MSADALTQSLEQKRRTERILLRIPVEVSGTGTDGKTFREKTHTMAINRHGARVALLAPVQRGGLLKITNLQNAKTCAFRVVAGVDKSLSGAPEWGVECLEAGTNFWGIFFPEKAPGSARQELIDVLLECSQCHTRELAHLSLGDYQGITSAPSLQRVCESCGTTTDWTFGVVAADRGQGPEFAGAARDAQAHYAERRRANRVPVKLPVRIRMEEIGRTENLSTCGVCFSSTLLLKVGDKIKLTVGFSPGKNEKEVSARVVWQQPLEGGASSLYGVELTEEI
jgi:hypothetical protein